MKKLLTLAFMVVAGSIVAQEFPKMDASPMDAAYFPPRAAFRAFAKSDEEKKANEPKIRVIYSRPQKKDRDVFPGLQKYGEVWRLGANESTEIMFFTDVKVGDTNIKAGRYTIYCIPQESEWEVHFSTDTDGWGHYAFKPEASSVASINFPSCTSLMEAIAFALLSAVS